MPSRGRRIKTPRIRLSLKAKRNVKKGGVVGIIQRYSCAAISSDLTDDEHHHSTEVLAAVALSGQLGSQIFRVKYSNDATTFNQLFNVWKEIVKQKAKDRKWSIEGGTTEIARLSLEHWLTDVCPACMGRGHQPHSGIPNVLSDDPCPVCNGTAKRKINAPQNVIQYVTDMVEVLETMTLRAGSNALRKLRSEMDF